MNYTLIFTDMYSGYIWGTETVDKEEWEDPDCFLRAASKLHERLSKERKDYEYGTYETTDGFAVHVCPDREWAESLLAEDTELLTSTLGEPDEYVFAS